MCGLHDILFARDRSRVESLPGRGSYAFILHHLLGEHLIHSDRGAEIARSCIRDSKHVEGRLHAPVFAVHSVKRHKYDIRLAADLEHSLSEQRRALPLSRFSYRLKIRRRTVKSQILQRRKILKEFCRLSFYVLKTHEQVHQYCLMPPLSERSAYLCSRKKGYISFRAQSAAQNYDLHNDLLMIAV